MTYTQVFGGNTIYPSDVSYLLIELTDDITLEWPIESPSGNLPVSRIMDIDPSGAFSITMPPADETSVGQTILFNNLGPSTVDILDNDGGTILSIAAGDQWQIYLIDNSDAAGTWRSFRYGAATAQAQAAALAGFGLTPTGSTLSQEYPVTEFSANFSLAAANRAAAFVWTGGIGTLSLPTSASVGDGWFVNVRNAGTGVLTIDPAGGETINDASTITLQPGDSAVIINTGTEWFTVGLGKQAVFTFDYTSIDLTGQSSPYTLSGAELNRIAYRFTGVLTANMEIVVPPTVQQYWVDNDTSGAFTLGLKTAAQVGNADVTQGARAILYSDGSEVVAADTSSIAVPIAVSDGGTGANTAGGALINLGGSATGIAIFTAATTNDIWTALGRAPIGTVDGGAF